MIDINSEIYFLLKRIENKLDLLMFPKIRSCDCGVDLILSKWNIKNNDTMVTYADCWHCGLHWEFEEKY